MSIEIMRATCLGETIPHEVEKVFYLHKSRGIRWSIRDSNHWNFKNIIRKNFDATWVNDHWQLESSEQRNLFITKALKFAAAPSEYFFIENEKMFRDVTVNATLIDNDFGYFSHNNPYIASSLLNKSWLKKADVQQNKWWEYSTIVLQHSAAKVLEQIKGKGAKVNIVTNHECAPVLLAEYDNAFEFICSPEIEPLHFLLRDKECLFDADFNEEIKFGNWNTNSHQRKRPNNNWDGSIWTEKHKVHHTIKLCHQYSIPIIYP